MNLLYDDEENGLLLDMVIRLLEKHTGIHVSDEQYQHIIDSTIVFRCQPVTGMHIIDVDVEKTKEYLQKHADMGKTQVVFFGTDELLQDFSLDKTQSIAEACKHMFDRFYYLNDDLKADQVYAKFCADTGREPVLTMWGGVHYALHDPTQCPTKSFVNPTNRPYKYVFYSRRPRSARLCMLGFLLRHDLIKHGLISAFPEELIKEQAETIEVFKPFDVDIQAVIDNWDKFPMVLDCVDPWTSEKNLCSVIDDNYIHRESSYFSLVSETHFFDDSLPLCHLGAAVTTLGGQTFTEKTFRPFQCEHPFVLLAKPHSLSLLRERGFKTFGDWWDESYDECENDTLRLRKCQYLVKELCSKSNEEWDAITQEMQPILQHNAELLNTRPFNFITTNQHTVEQFLTGE